MSVGIYVGESNHFIFFLRWCEMDFVHSRALLTSEKETGVSPVSLLAKQLGKISQPRHQQKC